MAALFHRACYPNDVDATVAYVAPVMIGPVDPRVDAFLASAGGASFRAAVKRFQKTCLERRDELLFHQLQGKQSGHLLGGREDH